jgi:pimeloyl-ACP methyl ester carboxylesterase
LDKGETSFENPAMMMKTLPVVALCLLTSLDATAPEHAQSYGWAKSTASKGLATCNADTVRVAVPAGMLEGSLLCPASAGPWPVVLLIAGSGPTDRNGNSPFVKSNSYRLLAEALATRGIASLRYDKRGIGASSRSIRTEADLRFDMAADDAAAWVRLLRGDARFTTTTVVGHSEGSLLGMLATQRGSADAFVSVAGIGRSADRVIHEQLMAAAPAPLVADADRIMALLRAGKTADTVPPALFSLFRASVQPYIISWFKYDPVVEMRRLRVPVLIVQGTTDIQVKVQDAQLLGAADNDATVTIIDGMNHVLKTVPADQSAQMQSYSDPYLPVNTQLVAVIATFVGSVRRQ